jgi:hypothetical protein
MEKKGRLVEISDAMLEKIKIKRLGTEDNGFQRKLNTERSREIVESVKDGATMPPIFIASVGNELILVDGQHRFEARKLHKFPLYGLIVPMEHREMVKNFVEMNHKAIRVQLNHRLTVDPSRNAIRMRSLAKKYDCGNNRIYHLLGGILGVVSWDWNTEVSEENWKLTEDILKFWSADDRWVKKDECYSASGTLKIVGRFARKAHLEFKPTLEKLQKMNYSRGGPIHKIVGTNQTCQSLMASYIYRFMFDRD